MRGAVVTAAFLVGIDGLVVLQGLSSRGCSGPARSASTASSRRRVVTVLALKRVGIDEAFVQRDTDDRRATSSATRSRSSSRSPGLATLLLCVLAPVLAAAYDQPRLLGLTLGVAWLPLAFALLAPLWVFFRRMDYARQRSLQAIQPVVTFAVTVPLAAWTDLGVWSIVVGLAAGYAVSVRRRARAVALPPGPALRPRRRRARYLRFSGWVFVALVAAMVVVQGQVIAFEVDGGLAAVGFITLAATLTRYVDRADQIVTATIYPAVCAIQGRTAALEELFVKSNRATLLYAAPFGVGVVLFAPDLVAFALGDDVGARPSRCCRAWRWPACSRSWGSTGSLLPRARRPAAAGDRGGRGGRRASSCSPCRAWRCGASTASSPGAIAAVALALVWRARYVRALLPGVRLGALVGGALPPLLAATAVRAGAAPSALGRDADARAGARRGRALLRGLRRAGGAPRAGAARRAARLLRRGARGRAGRRPGRRRRA